MIESVFTHEKVHTNHQRCAEEKWWEIFTAIFLLFKDHKFSFVRSPLYPTTYDERERVKRTICRRKSKILFTFHRRRINDPVDYLESQKILARKFVFTVDTFTLRRADDDDSKCHLSSSRREVKLRWCRWFAMIKKFRIFSYMKNYTAVFASHRSRFSHIFPTQKHPPASNFHSSKSFLPKWNLFGLFHE